MQIEIYIIMLSVNFFCNISSYDILAYITKNYIALIYYAKIDHLLCQFHAGKVGFSAVCQAIHTQIAFMCWANVGDWLVQLVDGWRWRHIIGPTLAQRIFITSYYDAVGPTLAQRNSTNSYSDVVSPVLA